jgi:hypothetical protein
MLDALEHQTSFWVMMVSWLVNKNGGVFQLEINKGMPSSSHPPLPLTQPNASQPKCAHHVHDLDG